MRVNFNTNNMGYGSTNKNAKNTQFGATIKAESLTKAVGDTVEFIGGKQARILTNKLNEAKDVIKDLTIEGKDLVLAFAITTTRDVHSGGRNYTRITPTVKSVINEKEFSKSSSFPVNSDTKQVGTELADEFIKISRGLTEQITNSRTLIEEEVKAIEKYINGAK